MEKESLTGKKKRRISIVIEVAVLFIIGTITTGFLVYYSVGAFFSINVADQTRKHAAEISDTVRFTVTEYRAYPWLIEYWYANSDSLDIEYDTALEDNSKTEQKIMRFSKRYPDLEPNYITVEECKALPKEDQKLLAEIAYSLILARLDEIKKSFHVEYLFCVVSDEPYEKQFYLFSAAVPGETRGTGPEDVYLLGMDKDVSDTSTRAMRESSKGQTFMAFSDDVLDQYSCEYAFGEHKVFVGSSFNISELKEDIMSDTRSVAGIAIVHQIILAIICLLMLYIFILRPLRKLHRSIRSYSQNKDSDAARTYLAKIRSHNELGQISDDMIDLTREIDAYMAHIKTITSEQERIETELKLAGRIQTSMLPEVSRTYSDRSDFMIRASMDPAKEVGGDFYDFFLIDDDHLCMIIADVSDKGVPAALFMMESKIVISEEAKTGKNPAQILMDANRVIGNHNPEKLFVTVWIGILELSSGKLMAANAGHEYPTIKAPGGKFEVVNDEHDFVVGFMEGIEYHEYEMMLKPGTTLFLYTDGVPEAMDADDNLYGMERMVAALNEGADLKPDQLLSHIRSAVDDFVKDAEQVDDITMLCLEYKKQEEQ